MAASKPFVVTLDDRKLQQDLRRAINNCVNMRPAWKAVGELVVSSILMNFRDEGRPAKWQKFSPNTKRKRGEMADAKLLVDSGIMRKSLTQSSAIKSLGNEGVEVGTNVEYAATHQFGRGPIPARPFGTPRAPCRGTPPCAALYLRAGRT